MYQDDADMGPVREITTTTFDEHSASRHRVEVPPSSSSAVRSRTEMTNGTISEGIFHLPRLKNIKC